MRKTWALHRAIELRASRQGCQVSETGIRPQITRLSQLQKGVSALSLAKYLLPSPVPTAPGPVPPIRIESPSSTVTEGQMLDLNCVVAGQAHAQVTWYKRGGSLPARHQVLTPRSLRGPWSVAYIGVTAWQAGMEPLLGSGRPLTSLSCLARSAAPACTSYRLPWRMLENMFAGQAMGRKPPSQSPLQPTTGPTLPTVSSPLGWAGMRRERRLGQLWGRCLTVTSLPAPGSTSPIRIETSSSRVAEGQTLDLNCVVQGQAHAQVTWHKRGGSLPARHQVEDRGYKGAKKMGDSGWEW